METQASNGTSELMDLIGIIEHSIQKQKNKHSSQVHMEYSPELITFWAPK